MISVHISAFADTFVVTSQTEFNTAQSGAVAGDIIEWQSGTYSNIVMNVTKDGLIIRAQVAGDVIFNGSSRMSITADDSVISGFQFVGGNIGSSNVISIEAEDVDFTDINIADYTCFKYLIVDENSRNVDISYCNFENRVNYEDQNILSILVDDTEPGYHTIRYCSFKNFTDDDGMDIGDAGVEPIRIGVSSQRTFISRSIVEYCYFTQCNGDGEIISNKARQNVYRYNTFDNNPNAELVLRHGSENTVYGNFFLNGLGGIRIREGKDHFIFNNYFSGLTSRSIYLNDNDGDSTDDRLDRITIAYNTFIDTEEVRLDASGTMPTTNITLANNIFTQPMDDHFRDATGTETWIGNIAFGSLGIVTPASGITVVDPKVEINSEGFYGLASDSPAIDAAQTGYTAIASYTGLDIDDDILFDLMKEARPAAITSKDIGSVEFPHTAIIQPIATASNTGPSYFNPLLSVDTPVNVSTPSMYMGVFPNPNTDNINVIIKNDQAVWLELILFDSTGRKIKTLTDASLAPGENTIQENVSKIPSGIYLIQANTRELASDKQETQTMRFIKK
ncbi:hypothetical protein GCM10022393_27510 [Aquimarina addita]|uniref:Secretion system C-terminal sorting domain-containing protein n=2 Tax=Aquimarina addita TaxID=870485 RepID=A0ABP6UR32_9FLAO